MGRKRRKKKKRPGPQAVAPSLGEGQVAPPSNPAGGGDTGEFRLPYGLDPFLVILPALLIAFHPLATWDLPMHISIGEWILDHTTLPAADPFSFTAAGTPWVPHEWLVGLFFAIVEDLGGVTALTLALVAVSVLVAWIHRRLSRGLGVPIAAHLFWAMPLWIMVGRRLSLRPHLFALVLPLLLWWIILRAERHPRMLWLAPVVMVFWVNMHASFTMGLGILVLHLILLGRDHALPWRPRILVVALSAAAVLFAGVHIYYQSDLLSGIKHALERATVQPWSGWCGDRPTSPPIERALRSKAPKSWCREPDDLTVQKEGYAGGCGIVPSLGSRNAPVRAPDPDS